MGYYYYVLTPQGCRRTSVADLYCKLLRILDRLDASLSPKDMNLPEYKLHKLVGKGTNTWSVWVNGNWRVIFKFEGEDAISVNYED